MQSFGRYDTVQHAAEAYDIGCIIFKGCEMRLNFSTAKFLDNASRTFREELDLSKYLGVANSIAKALSGKGRKLPAGKAGGGVEPVDRVALLRFFRTPVPQIHEEFVRAAGLAEDLGLAQR
jgi:hypothetical protein